MVAADSRTAPSSSSDPLDSHRLCSQFRQYAKVVDPTVSK